MSARPSEQALVPTASSPQAVSTEGFDPSRKRTFKNRPPYLVWSPDGPTAPRKTHQTHKEALAIAHMMAAHHPGQTFYVMQTASRPVFLLSQEEAADA